MPKRSLFTLRFNHRNCQLNRLLTRLAPFGFALVLMSGGTAAAGLWRWEQSVSGLGVAYAGSAASAENASALYYNPAVSAVFPRPQLSLGRARTMPNAESVSYTHLTLPTILRV